MPKAVSIQSQAKLDLDAERLAWYEAQEMERIAYFRYRYQWNRAPSLDSFSRLFKKTEAASLKILILQFPVCLLLLFSYSSFATLGWPVFAIALAWFAINIALTYTAYNTLFKLGHVIHWIDTHNKIAYDRRQIPLVQQYEKQHKLRLNAPYAAGILQGDHPAQSPSGHAVHCLAQLPMELFEAHCAPHLPIRDLVALSHCSKDLRASVFDTKPYKASLQQCKTKYADIAQVHEVKRAAWQHSLERAQTGSLLDPWIAWTDDTTRLDSGPCFDRLSASGVRNTPFAGAASLICAIPIAPMGLIAEKLILLSLYNHILPQLIAVGALAYLLLTVLCMIGLRYLFLKMQLQPLIKKEIAFIIETDRSHIQRGTLFYQECMRQQPMSPQPATPSIHTKADPESPPKTDPNQPTPAGP